MVLAIIDEADLNIFTLLEIICAGVPRLATNLLKLRKNDIVVISGTKSAKRCLKKCIGKNCLTYDELLTS